MTSSFQRGKEVEKSGEKKRKKKTLSRVQQLKLKRLNIKVIKVK